MALMNQVEYARHRGVSKVAVHKAIKSGRISKAVKDGKIDSEAADALWVHNTDQSKPLNSVTGTPKLRKASPDAPPMPAAGGREAAEEAPAAADAGANGAQQVPGGGPSYVAARAFRESYLARLARLEFEEKSGKLIDADQVRVAAFNAARRARDMVLSLADRIAPLVAGEPDQFKCHEIIRGECFKICEDIKKYGDEPIAAGR